MATFTSNGTPITQPSPQYDLPIICNNGVLKVNRNLYSTEYHDKTLSQSDGVTVSTTSGINVSAMVNCTNIKSFMVTSADPEGSYRLFKYRPDGTFINATTVTIVGQVLVLPSDCGYFRIQYVYLGTGTENILIYDSAHNLGIYTDGTQEVVTDSLGNTASAERLLAVGTYKDTQEVIAGSVTRNIGIYVLDGTETWSKSSTYAGSFYSSGITPPDGTKVVNNPNVYCTHGFKVGSLGEYASASIGAIYWYSSTTINYKYDDGTATVAQFKQWLSDQYAQGTPVIVVYPTSSTTSEAVAGQFLSKSPVTQTAGSISNLPIAITESQKTVPTPTQPLPINCNNGVVKVSPNLFDISTATPSMGINATKGYMSPQSAVVSASDYIPVSGGKNYTLNTQSWTTQSSGIAWYNTNKEYISGQAYTGLATQTFTAPANAYYARITVRTNHNPFQFEQGSSATPYTPYYAAGYYTDGTTETVEIAWNLFDKTTVTSGYRLTNVVGKEYGTITTATGASNDFVSASDYFVSALIPVEVGKTYIKNSPTEDAYHRYKTYNANQIAVRMGDANSITIQSGEAYIAFCGYLTELDDTTLYGSTSAQTATAENLFKVGTYQDVQSVIDGGVTRNVGVKVLDGTENWAASATTGKFFIPTAVSDWNAIARNATGYCTHAVFNSSSASDNGKVNFDLNSFCFYYSTSSTTLTAFKQYLVDQYNAGTPVIIVYPLATPTTETVTAQPMNIQAGTNIVQITQGSIDGLELEVKYKAGVSVTITEIENAQLDDNVEVTING